MIKEFLHFCNPSAMAFDHLFISELPLIILRQFVTGIFMQAYFHTIVKFGVQREKVVPGQKEINRHWSGCAMD